MEPTDGLDFTSFLIRKHPFALLFFLLSAVSTLCLCPLFSAYEVEINRQYPWTVNISWIEFGCIVGFFYMASFIYCIILFARRK
jgi:hypothetical protein